MIPNSSILWCTIEKESWVYFFSHRYVSFCLFFKCATQNKLRGYLCNLRWKKEWICSERPISICTIVKGWTCQGSGIWPNCDITWRHRPMKALVSFTSQRNLCTNMRRMRLLGYSLQSACSGWPAGFMSTCFYLSKMQQSIESFLMT